MEGKAGIGMQGAVLGEDDDGKAEGGEAVEGGGGGEAEPLRGLGIVFEGDDGLVGQTSLQEVDATLEH